MTVTIIFIIGIVPFIFAHLVLCQSSLRYYVDKYKISEETILTFLKDLNPKLLFMLKDSSGYLTLAYIRGYLELEEYLIHGNGVNPYGERLIGGMLLIIAPISFLFGVFQQESVIDRILCFIYATILAILFYKSWRFGHSLKSKAQHDQSPTD